MVKYYQRPKVYSLIRGMFRVYDLSGVFHGSYMSEESLKKDWPDATPSETYEYSVA